MLGISALESLGVKMKGKTLVAIGGLVAALGLAGCSETYDDANWGADCFVTKEAGWEYVANTETVKDKDCSSQYPGFPTRIIKVRGINAEGNLDNAEVCCTLEQNIYNNSFWMGTQTYITAGYCDFLKQ